MTRNNGRKNELVAKAKVSQPACPRRAWHNASIDSRVCANIKVLGSSIDNNPTCYLWI